MKQKIKRFVLWLCMIASLVSLTACAGTSDSGQNRIDPQLEASYCPQFEQFLAAISSYTPEQLDEFSTQLQSDTSMDKEEMEAYVGGFSTLKSIKDDLGGFVSVLSSELTEGSGRGEYICIVSAQYEKRTMEYKAFFTTGQTGIKITSMSFSPEYTIGERMQKAGLNTLMGLAVVFAVLVFISILIYCFKFISPHSPQAKPVETQAAPAANVPPAVSSDEEELVAVIAAAIAASEEEDADLAAAMTAAVIAYEGGQTGSGDALVARSIRHARRTKRRW